MFEKTKQFLDSYLEMGVPGFDLAVYKNGECILRYMNGYADLENKIRHTGKERYNIYSCSKVITCTAALQLWEKGLFSLDDKLSDYMPEFENIKVRTNEGIVKPNSPILVKQLFEMSAGFSYDIPAPSIIKCQKETNGVCQTREFMKYYAEDPLYFHPGDFWAYSLCHDVLAAFVEVVSGEKFETYVKKNIFDVVGMNDSTFMLPKEELETIAPQYRFENGKAVNVGKDIVTYKFGSEYASGGAGCISTVDDYVKFLEGLRKGILLKPETVEFMRTDRLNDKTRREYWLKETHGYGLGVRCPKGEKPKGEFGWGGAASAFLSLDLEEDLTVYFGCHLLSSPANGLRIFIPRFIKAELLGTEDFEQIKKEIAAVTDYNYTF